MAMVLAEVFQETPQFAAAVFGLNGNRPYRAVTEYCYNSDSSSRADLVLLEPNADEVAALMEIKYEDEKTPSIFRQTLAYSEWARKNGVPFLLLTKDPPTPKVQALLFGPCTYMSYAALYREGQQFFKAGEKKARSYPIIRMLGDFLREETPVFNNSDFDKKILQLLLVRGLGLRHKTGLGKLNSRDNMQEAINSLDRLVENIGVLADRFHQNHRRILGNRPIVSFTFMPYIDYSAAFKTITRELKNNTGEDVKKTSTLMQHLRSDYTDIPLEPEIKTGGCLSIEASYSLGKVQGKGIGFYHAIELELDLTGPALSLSVSAASWGQKGKDYKCKKLPLGLLTKEDNLFNALTAVTLKSLSATVVSKDALGCKKFEAMEQLLKDRHDWREDAIE
jgi:hypothetical protein